MRKKIILIIFMLLVTSGLLYFAKDMQRQEAAKQQAATSNPVSQEQQNNTPKSSYEEEAKKEQVKTSQDASKENAVKAPEAPKADTTAKNSNEPQKATAPSKTEKTEPKTIPVQAPNLIITDSVSGKVILSKTAAYNGETAAQATSKALDAAKISYKISTFGDAVYFSSINGIRERSAGPSSGWCYYINGKKLGTGAGSYKLNKNDKLEWKFLKDGVSN